MDYTRIVTAIVKCSYEASGDVEESWPDDTYDGIDWFGIWDDVCQSPGTFTFEEQNTFCGPACVLPGTTTTKCAIPAAVNHICGLFCGSCCLF
jgi:hypothetical protein